MTAPARKLAEQVVHCLRKRVAFGDTNSASVGLEIGTIPAGSFVLPTDVNIETAFNAGTTNVLTVGIDSTVSGLVINSDAAAGTSGFKSSKTGTLNGNTAVDLNVKAYFSQTGTAATTGQADICIKYYPFSN